MCARCDELEEEVAYLRSELGVVQNADHIRKLKAAFGLGRGAAFILSALYGAGGKTLSRLQILDHLPARESNGERSDKGVDVRLVYIRRAIGKESVESVWGQGFRLTPSGLEIVRTALETRRAA